MVIVNRSSSSSSSSINRRFVDMHRWIQCGLVGMLLVYWAVVFKLLSQVQNEEPAVTKSLQPPKPPPPSPDKFNNITTINGSQGSADGENGTRYNCRSRSSILRDLTADQRDPDIGPRWIVRPPPGGNLYLMCCDTTKGPFSVLLHERWAPIGVRHLVSMLEGGQYFDTEIPLFRCTDACQFGLSSNQSLTKQYRGRGIPDDPLWLPTGPGNRFSSDGKIKRYPKGVLTHAGAGNNSRGVQLVLTLKPNKFMGGGSPWEVPLGEVVSLGKEGKDSNDDVWLPDIFTGYGEKGPPQGLLMREGVSESVRRKWPLLDYVLKCSILDRLIVD